MGDKPGTPRSDRDPRESARKIALVQEQITRAVRLSEMSDKELDLRPVWNGEEYGSLPEDAKNELKDWAVAQGYREADQAAPEGEPGEKELTLRQLFERVAQSADMVGKDPDFTPVRNSEEYASLPEGARRRLDAWAEAQGFGASAPAQAEPAPTTERVPAERPQEGLREESKENERPQKPRKRQFRDYRIKKQEEDGTRVVIEDFAEWDRQADEYRDRSVRTTIQIPREIAARMEADPAAAEEFIRLCEAVRLDLDRPGKEGGLVLYFDGLRRNGPNTPENVLPRWKYQLSSMNERASDDAVVPENIMALAIANPDRKFLGMKEYTAWLGKPLQEKREAIINDLARKKFGPAETANVPAAATERQAAEVREPAPWSDEDLRYAVREMLRELAEKASSTDDAAFLVKIAPFFVKDKLGLMRPPRESVPEARLNAVVRDTLAAHYREGGNEAMAAQIEELMLDEETAESVKKFGKEYVDLRRKLESEDLAQGIRELEGLAAKARDGGLDRAMTEAIGTLDVEIEHGMFGADSEDRLEGLRRSDEERAFFDEHPALDKRNIQKLPDGRVIIYVDRLHPHEAIRRALDRLTEDALGPADDRAEQELRNGIVDELSKKFEGKGEMIIKDSAELAEIIRKLRRKLAPDGK